MKKEKPAWVAFALLILGAGCLTTAGCIFPRLSPEAEARLAAVERRAEGGIRDGTLSLSEGQEIVAEIRAIKQEYGISTGEALFYILLGAFGGGGVTGGGGPLAVRLLRRLIRPNDTTTPVAPLPPSG